ncbi:MAG: tetratricopeptide repeat protein [Myxococcota bacterium]
MPRSAVLRGCVDARDRAKARRRRDRRPSEVIGPYHRLDAWLAASPYRDLRVHDLRRLDVALFLRRTDAIELLPAERLRQLAIFLEGRHSSFEAEAVDRVYQAALRLAPKDLVVWHSRGVTAKAFAYGLSSSPAREKLKRRARHCLERAWNLDPTDAWSAYSLGKWHYDFASDTLEALRWFEEAVRLDPAYGLARLFCAHALHDLERWGDAVDAYEAVPLNAFDGPRVWRIDHLLECLAHCRLRAGDHAGAARDFLRLLDRLEKEPRKAHMLSLHMLEAAAEGPLWASIWPRYQIVASAPAFRKVRGG